MYFPTIFIRSDIPSHSNDYLIHQKQLNVHCFKAWKVDRGRAVILLGLTVLGPVYTKRQRQLCDNSAMTLAILFSLKTMESLENRLKTQSGATPLFSMRTESQASSQSCRTVDADAWYKWALNDPIWTFQAIQMLKTPTRCEKHQLTHKSDKWGNTWICVSYDCNSWNLLSSSFFFQHLSLILHSI